MRATRVSLVPAFACIAGGCGQEHPPQEPDAQRPQELVLKPGGTQARGEAPELSEQVPGR